MQGKKNTVVNATPVAQTTIPAKESDSALDILASNWASVVDAAGANIWGFGQALAAFMAANPNVTQTVIGTALAKQVNRSKPYSKSFISRAVKASKTFPNKPETAAESEAFLEAFYGNVPGKNKEANKRGLTKAQALANVAMFAKKAVELGASPSDAIETVRSAVTTVALATAA